ncbi:hypothetical protein BDY21DRAFT_290575, partial [Lineolata rhizophorae]
LSNMHVRKKSNLSIKSTSTVSALASPPLLSPRPGANSAHRTPLLGSHVSPRSPHSPDSTDAYPPPSPSLPSLIPGHGKRKPAEGSRLVRRFVIAVVVTAALFLVGLQSVYSHSRSSDESSQPQQAFQLANGSALPRDPAAVVIGDANSPRWSVSISPSLTFPLQVSNYRRICEQSGDIGHQFSESHHRILGKRHRGYYDQDPNYVDVAEAVRRGYLPAAEQQSRLFEEGGNVIGFEDGAAVEGMPVCERSLTYVMETSDAGFGSTLMGLWSAYGLAEKEERAFFVDDTRWAYGKYTSYFVPPPKPTCLPPPTNHIVPCPHQADHLLVSSATVRWTWGHAFTEEFEDPKQRELGRQHNIFALLRRGYEDLFVLAGEDGSYVEQRARALYGSRGSREANLDGRRDTGTSDGDGSEEKGWAVGVHVRHGDRHPMEYQYSRDYLPLMRYIDAADALLTEYLNSTHSPTPAAPASPPAADGDTGPEQSEPTTSPLPQFILASDDPDVYTAPEMEAASAKRAQDRIKLATKAELEAAQGGKSSGPVDEIAGWEGGFFRDVFWSLGRPAPGVGERNGGGNGPKPTARSGKAKRDGVGNAPANEEDVPEAVLALRELVGRAYLLDLAVLGRADAVVCAVSATACRILAVMVGWEGVLSGERWVNVDGSFIWKGIDW